MRPRWDNGTTALGGFGLYLDLMRAMDLGAAVRRDLHVAGERGWLDIQMVVTLLALNLAGGDRVEDLDGLSRDRGFVALLGEAEKALLRHRERRSLKAQMRRGGEEGIPSSTALRDWLEKFRDPAACSPPGASGPMPPGGRWRSWRTTSIPS